MELDELKQRWNQVNDNQSTNNHNIMDMIRHNSNGPVAALKQSYKRQMVVMIILPIAIFLTNLTSFDKTITSALFWSYVLFCVGVFVFAKYNYNTVSRMEGSEGMVKEHLEKQVAILETRVRQNIIGLKVALLFFITLTEVLPYLQDFSTLNKWHSLSPFIRFGVYLLFFVLQHFATRQVSERKFGQHISRLKDLVQQMQ